MQKSTKQIKRYTRHRRVRSRIFGTSDRPRISVFRSNKNIFAQLVDDEKSNTIVSASSSELRNKSSKKDSEKKKIKDSLAKIQLAFSVGKLLAEKALAKKINSAVFDRGGYKYHGSVKAIAEGARKGGLRF